MDIFQIGTASVMPGERAYGNVVVAKKTDGTDISFPVILVRGQKDGPVLCLNAAIHGDEFAGIETVIRLANELDPAELTGTLVGVPVVNVLAYAEADRVNPYDYKDLNRSFPGSPAGSLTQRIAHAFLNEIVLKCTAMIDLHGGGGRADINYTVIAQSGYEELVWDMALATGFDLVWLGGPWGGTGRISALEAGIPAITVEVGGGMECRERDVALHTSAVRGVMRYLGMLQGEVEPPQSYRMMKGGTTYAQNGGFFHPLAGGGESIQSGQLLGRTTDFFGQVVEEFHAYQDGLVVEMRMVPTIRPGDSVCILGYFVDTY
ncbi:MAG: succinylglutamate desuccinylase/aspartoacylase family protein [Anaerolineales bacterium]|nr:succinylglutamate desuccinylase/aspartoacylase family protein [Anaerolineales bacterium]